MSDFLERLVARTLVHTGIEAPVGTIQPRLYARFEPLAGMSTLPPFGNDLGGEEDTVPPSAPPLPISRLSQPATVPSPLPSPTPSLLVAHPAAPQPPAPAGSTTPSPPTAAPPRPSRQRVVQRKESLAAAAIQPVKAPITPPVIPPATLPVARPLPSASGPPSSLPEHTHEQLQTRPAGEVVARTAPAQPAAEMGLRPAAVPLDPPPALTTQPYTAEQALAHLRAEIQRLRPSARVVEDSRIPSPPERMPPRLTSVAPPGKGDNGRPRVSLLSLPFERLPTKQLPTEPLPSGWSPPEGSPPDRWNGRALSLDEQTMARLRVAMHRDSSPPRQPKAAHETPPRPVISVHIGRIELRAIPPAPPAPGRSRPRPAVQSLDDYLRRRNGQGGQGE
jgi:hypothetical protein